MAEVVVCENITKVYGDGVPVPALNGVSLTAQAGEFIAVVGESGSGKSTLLNILGALDRPSSGRVEIDGIALADLTDASLARLRNEKLGFVFQFHYLLADFTALENVAMPVHIQGNQRMAAAQARSRELLDAVGLGDKLHRRPSQLSGGEQQRVAIARALTNNPRLVLADEPTGNLDNANSGTIFQLLREINRRQNTTVIIVTHDQTLAGLADRIIRMRDGVLVDDTEDRGVGQ